MRRMSPISKLRTLAATTAGFTEADKEVLVKIVKHAQWQGVRGTKGPWKNFLATVDRSLSKNHDPAKRPWNVLAKFVETWKDEKDLEILKRAREYIKYNHMVDALQATEPWPDCPEENFVRLTRQHPLFSRDYNFCSFHEGWMRSEIVKAKDLSTPAKLLALDCEMVLCEDGSLQVVRVCLVDQDLQTLIDTLVKPSKRVTEYKSHITGVTAEDLQSVTVTQSDIQTQMKGTFSPETIIVGHSVYNDLKALNIDHRRVIDTAYLFPIQNRPRTWSPPLRDLCKLILGYDFRDDSKPHDCLEDAKIPMKLVLHCIEHGLTPLSVPDEVDEAVLSKLLIHKIPKEVNYESLKLIFPRRISFKFQDIENGGSKSKFFSTFAVFASKEVANSAFDQLKGIATEDLTGRLFKTVLVSSKFQHRNAVKYEVVVRKMDNNFRNNMINLEKAIHRSTADAGLDVVVEGLIQLETAEHVGVGPLGDKVSDLKRSRTEEDVKDSSVIPVAKKLKKKKKKKSQDSSPVNGSVSSLHNESSKANAEGVENVMEDEEPNVVDPNVYDVLMNDGSPVATHVQQTDLSGTHRSSKKRRSKKQHK